MSAEQAIKLITDLHQKVSPDQLTYWAVNDLGDFFRSNIALWIHLSPDQNPHGWTLGRNTPITILQDVALRSSESAWVSTIHPDSIRNLDTPLVPDVRMILTSTSKSLLKSGSDSPSLSRILIEISDKDQGNIRLIFGMDRETLTDEETYCLRVVASHLALAWRARRTSGSSTPLAPLRFQARLEDEVWHFVSIQPDALQSIHRHFGASRDPALVPTGLSRFFDTSSRSLLDALHYQWEMRCEHHSPSFVTATLTALDLEPLPRTPNHLTPREAETARWLCEGKSNAEIALILGISVRTAEKHVARLLRKLQVETRFAAMRMLLTAKE